MLRLAVSRINNLSDQKLKHNRLKMNAIMKQYVWDVALSANRETASAHENCPIDAELYIIFILFINIKSIIKVEKKLGHHGPLH